MNSIKHILLSVFTALFIVVLGTTGYMAIEGWNLLDSLYMTVITLSTVGYNEVRTTDDIGRVFTICLIFLGVGFFLYIAGAIVQFMVEGRIRAVLGRRRLERKIDQLKNHYIICGYGRIGSILCKNIRRKPLDLVVIEKNPDLIPAIDEDGILYVSGDASDESNLIKTGIERAKGLIAALGSDADNVFLVLTARQLNPDLFILARASRQESISKLTAAGATQVVSPYDIGAASMAQRVLRPALTSFLELAFMHERKDIQMEEMPVSASSKLANVMLKDSGIRQKLNLIIIAIKTSDGGMLFNPSFETPVRAGDTVIAVGEVGNLEKLETILNP
ncbi:MAG: potassium channel family protein [Desulfobacterales bacterium]